MGEELQCCRNPRDPSAVAVTVGHVPRKICSCFLGEVHSFAKSQDEGDLQKMLIPQFHKIV